MKPVLILCLSLPTVFPTAAQISKGLPVTSHTPLMHAYTYTSHAVRMGTILGISFWLALGGSLLSLWCSALFLDSHCERQGSLWALRQDLMTASGFKKHAYSKCFCWTCALTSNVTSPMGRLNSDLVQYSPVFSSYAIHLKLANEYILPIMKGKCSFFLLLFNWMPVCTSDLPLLAVRWDWMQLKIKQHMVFWLLKVKKTTSSHTKKTEAGL